MKCKKVDTPECWLFVVVMGGGGTCKKFGGKGKGWQKNLGVGAGTAKKKLGGGVVPGGSKN